VGGDVDAQRLAVAALGADHGLVDCRAGLAVDRTGALRLQQPAHQRRGQCGADGVGALDAQLHGLGHGQRGDQAEQKGEQAVHAGDLWHRVAPQITTVA
jgi:hypothetical protein